MPLYEYKCDSCGSVFEVREKFSDKPLTVHDGCGGTVERLISTSAFVFKGTGFYATDYKRKGGGNGSNDSQTKDGALKAEAKADAKADGKSDAKTEVKTESKPSAPESTKPPSAASEPSREQRP
ncbi:MAG: zinc ribbon domain-containing protein [Bryobacterales bacterium]|nr:zinc ribbon domain-containing protein [Bryobacterales bacterium]